MTGIPKEVAAIVEAIRPAWFLPLSATQRFLPICLLDTSSLFIKTSENQQTTCLSPSKMFGNCLEKSLARFAYAIMCDAGNISGSRYTLVDASYSLDYGNVRLVLVK